jgi:hypothetical protein
MARSETPTEMKVVVIRDSDAVLATVSDPTKTPWSVIEDATGEKLNWGVLVYADCYPLAFTNREKALEWARSNACAKYFDLTFLTDPQLPETGEPESAGKNQS